MNERMPITVWTTSAIASIAELSVGAIAVFAFVTDTSVNLNVPHGEWKISRQRFRARGADQNRYLTPTPTALLLFGASAPQKPDR